jgi:predicted nucleic acid-binding protein
VRLDDLPDGATVFVDANVFTYYLTGTDTLAQTCAAFFERTVRREVTALTSVVVAMEVIHRAIVQEAAETLNLRSRELLQHLKKHPDVVKMLVRHRTIPAVIYRLGVSIEPVTHILAYESRWARQKYGLMANDSLIVAFMRKRRIRHLVTNDADFERVSDIKVWLPC